MEDPVHQAKHEQDQDFRKKISINTFMAIPFLALNFYDVIFFAVYTIITIGLLIYKVEKYPMPDYAINTEIVIIVFFALTHYLRFKIANACVTRK